MKTIVCVVSTVIALSGGTAAAQSVVPLTASRDVSVDSFVVDTNSYSSAYDSDEGKSATLVPFDRTLDRFLKLGTQKATTYSRQQSTITPQALNLSIIVDETAKSPSPGLAFGHSTSGMTTQYLVTEATRVRVIGTLTTQTDTGADALISFSMVGPSGSVVSSSRSTPGTSSISQVGMLLPGTYTVLSSADVSAQSSPSPTTLHSRATATVSVQFYCAADFDMSGFVDLEDYASFVAAFEAGAEEADVDVSGFVDTDDFTAFIQAFENAC